MATLEHVLRRERVLMALGLVAMTVLAWTYLVRTAAGMNAMAAEAQMHAAMGMADMRAWGFSDLIGLFVMWAVMMVAMMVPSAAPVIILVLAVYRRRGDSQSAAAAALFTAGYLLVWTLFSMAASGGQLLLHRMAMLGPDMRVRSEILSGVLLLAAGVYQWLPVKNVCLTQCQSPLGFLARYWREGAVGGLLIGIRHGLFCLGCCWLLMTMLFVVGVMNLLWVSVLAGLVLVEKLVPRGALLGRVAGLAIAAWGIYLLT